MIRAGTWMVVAGLVAGAGCGKDSKCEAVVEHMAKLVSDNGQPVSANDKAELVAQCKQQEWPEEGRKCLVEAKQVADFDGCFAKIPAFQAYATKSKTTEARQFVKKLYDGARAFYMDAGFGGGGLQPEPMHFPKQSVGPTPPLGACCEQGGKCMPDASLWTHESWVQLQFSVDDPHYYSYQYEVIDPQKKFVVRAFGDLDCDGTYSTFEMVGEITPGNPDAPSGSVGLERINELE